MRLQEDPPTWLADIIQAWEPLLLPNEDITVRLVKPQPPCTHFQCVLAHLIIEQSEVREHAAGVISIWQPDNRLVPLRHSAYSLPQLLNYQAVLHIAGLQDTCLRTTCNVRLGALPFGLFDMEYIVACTCLVVHVRPTSIATSSTDPLDDFGALLQLSGPRPATSLSSPASILASTWFVDQRDLHRHVCECPREVWLSGDTTSWTQTLRWTWRDLCLPGAFVDLQIVSSSRPEQPVQMIVPSLALNCPVGSA